MGPIPVIRLGLEVLLALVLSFLWHYIFQLPMCDFLFNCVLASIGGPSLHFLSFRSNRPCREQGFWFVPRKFLRILLSSSVVSTAPVFPASPTAPSPSLSLYVLSGAVARGCGTVGRPAATPTIPSRRTAAQRQLDTGHGPAVRSLLGRLRFSAPKVHPQSHLAGESKRALVCRASESA